MADRSEVEVLVNLPFFQNLFDQMMSPMLSSLDSYSADDVFPSEGSKESAVEAYRFIFDGMIEISADFYCEILTNSEVRELVVMYQSPVFLKLQVSMEQIMPKMLNWFEQNEERIDDLLEKANALA